MSEKIIHEHRTRVRYQETDQMGVVYHSNYLIYFELGRTEFLRSHGLAYSELEDKGIRLAVVEAKLKFRGSAKYDDPLLIRTWIEDHGHASINFGYQVLHDGTKKLLTEGSTALACLDFSQKLRKLPEEVLEFLKKNQ